VRLLVRKRIQLRRGELCGRGLDGEPVAVFRGRVLEVVRDRLLDVEGHRRNGLAAIGRVRASRAQEHSFNGAVSETTHAHEDTSIPAAPFVAAALG